MSLADDLYRETILDHYHHPRNQGVIEDPSVKVEGINPLCGDELTLYLDVKDNKLNDVRIKSRGCSINTASASMMTESVKGMSLAEAEKIISLFKDMMLSKNEIPVLPDDLEELGALSGVRNFPVRIKCALLPWNTLLEAITCIHQNGADKKLAPQTVTTE